MKVGFETVPLVDSSIRLISVHPGGRGALGLMTRSGVSHSTGMACGAQVCALTAGVWFRGNSVVKSFGSQPANDVLSAKGSSQKEKKSSLLN